MGATLRVPTAHFQCWEAVQEAAAARDEQLAWFAADASARQAYFEVTHSF